MTRSRSRAVHRVPERASRSVDHERGSVTLLAASVMLLAGIMCVVSVDLARGLQGRARAQVAADSAALAAAQEMALPGGRTPTEIAGEFASLNGAVLVSCKCASGSHEAIAEVQIAVHFLFLGPDRSVTARARAVLDIPGSS